jgi:hypothetical protein
MMRDQSRQSYAKYSIKTQFVKEYDSQGKMGSFEF